MQNKSKILGSLVVLIVVFIGLTFFYKSGKQKETISSVSNINELLVRDYSMKHGENKKNIYVVEFLDPECESCAIFNPVVRKLYKEYHEDIQIVIKYLANHNNSEFAIKLLEASREQNKYDEVLDVIFEKQPIWAQHNNEKPELLWELLTVIPNLDIEKLKSDMNNPKYDEIINTDTSDARKLGVRGTPTIFVNGVELKTLSTKALFDLVEAEIYK